jgi:hypothetical protein
MRTFANLISSAVVYLVLGGLVSQAHAQAPWSALPGSCASTDNNFWTPTAERPLSSDSRRRASACRADRSPSTAFTTATSR